MSHPFYEFSKKVPMPEIDQKLNLTIKILFLFSGFSTLVVSGVSRRITKNRDLPLSVHPCNVQAPLKSKRARQLDCSLAAAAAEAAGMLKHLRSGGGDLITWKWELEERQRSNRLRFRLPVELQIFTLPYLFTLLGNLSSYTAV